MPVLNNLTSFYKLIVYFFFINSEETATKKPPPSEDELQQFLIAFGMAVRNPSFHKVAQRLGQRENLENIIATCPELAKVLNYTLNFKPKSGQL